MYLKTILFAGIFCLVSCGDNQIPKEAVARVNGTYLFEEDLDGLLKKGVSKHDSALIVTNFIENWATQQLLLDRAKINLPLETQDKFELLVKDYREKLYIKAYKDALISRDLDTLFPDYQIEAFYMTHPDMFKLNENLLDRKSVV